MIITLSSLTLDCDGDSVIKAYGTRSRVGVGMNRSAIIQEGKKCKAL